jgi:hypothetical protein
MGEVVDDLALGQVQLSHLSLPASGWLTVASHDVAFLFFLAVRAPPALFFLALAVSVPVGEQQLVWSA